MELIKALYGWSERTFWNSLSKKLFSFLLLVLLDLAYVAIYYHQGQQIDGLMRSAGVAGEARQQIMASLDGGLHFMLGLTALALAWTVGQILYLRFLIVRPVRAITVIFDEIGRG